LGKGHPEEFPYFRPFGIPTLPDGRRPTREPNGYTLDPDWSILAWLTAVANEHSEWDADKDEMTSVTVYKLPNCRTEPCAHFPTNEPCSRILKRQDCGCSIESLLSEWTEADPEFELRSSENNPPTIIDKRKNV
jgi:hypothetical protein